MRIFAIAVCWVACLPGVLFAQNADILLNHDLYHYADRIDIRGLSGTFFPTSIKPYGRAALAEFLALADTQQMTPNEYKWHRRMRILADDEYASKFSRKGIWGTFYRNGAGFVPCRRTGRQV